MVPEEVRPERFSVYAWSARTGRNGLSGYVGSSLYAVEDLILRAVEKNVDPMVNVIDNETGKVVGFGYTDTNGQFVMEERGEFLL